MTDFDQSITSPPLPSVYVVGQTGPIIVTVGRFSSTTSLDGSGIVISIDPFNIDVGRFSVSSGINYEKFIYLPDVFTGLAITHKSPAEYTDFIEAERLSVYKKIQEGDFRFWEEIPPKSLVHRTCAFNPGGRFLCIGGKNLSFNGIATRAESFYSDFSIGFFDKDDYGYCPNISWSSDGKFMVAGWNNAAAKYPRIVFFRRGIYNEYQKDISPSGISVREGWLEAEVSPDNSHISITSDSNLEIYRILHPDPAAYPTYEAVTVNRDGVNFYNAAMAWSPDGTYLCIGTRVFKWDEDEEEFSIIETLSSAANPVYRPAWSPGGTYLAVVNNQHCYIHKRTGDSFSLAATISMTTGSVIQAVCFSACGNHVFLGGASAGPAFYQFDRDGDDFSQNIVNDFSDIKSDVTSISYAPDPFIENIARFQSQAGLQFDDFHAGLICDAGRFQTENAVRLDSIEILFSAVMIDVGRFSTNVSARTPQYALAFSIDRFSLAAGLNGSFLMDAVYADIGRFVLDPRFSDVKFFTLPGFGQVSVRYRCILTGANDGVDDLILPISSFQTRLRNGEKTYLGIIVPNVALYGDLVAQRTSGEIVIEMGYIQPTGSINYFEIVRVSMASIGFDRGPMRSSLSLAGYTQETNDMAKTIFVSGLQTEALQKDGRWRIRCDVASYIKPGDTVHWDDKSMVAGMIAINVGSSTSYMDITEAWDG